MNVHCIFLLISCCYVLGNETSIKNATYDLLTNHKINPNQTKDARIYPPNSPKIVTEEKTDKNNKSSTINKNKENDVKVKNSLNDTENIGKILISNHEVIDHIIDKKEEKKSLDLRKCCPEKNFYDLRTHECGKKTESFVDFINEAFPYLVNHKLNIFSEKLKSCELSKMPLLEKINTESYFTLLEDGSLNDMLSGTSYTNLNFCLELIGNGIDSLELVAAYCPSYKTVVYTEVSENKTLKKKDETFVSKCCPEGYYFDSRDSNCLQYFQDKVIHIKDTVITFFLNSTQLFHDEDLLCNGYAPQQISLTNTFLSGNQLCYAVNGVCYSTEEYCIEQISTGSNDWVAFVCSSSFINKCCPDGESLDVKGCSKTRSNSLYLTHLLMNEEYQINNAFIFENECTPVIFEESTSSNFSWFIDRKAHAVIKDDDNSITTRNYCIDDFFDGSKSLPVLKVCSEEVNIHHEIDRWTDNSLGKCCPLNMNYQQYNSSPVCEEREIKPSMREFFSPNILLYNGLPHCSGDDKYFSYVLQNSTTDYGKITADRKLTIVEMTNNCKIKETIIDTKEFCVEHMVNEEGKDLVPVALVCVPKTYKRGFINVILVGLSCAALISAFFALILMRVRRGMVTVRKINTLAGRIQLSYVLSLLIGYLSLGVGVLADPKEQVEKCYIIVGFILFFNVAGFCWNTSICAEGLLLTLQVKILERNRFLLHSLFSWGIPAIITVVALVMDSKIDQLDCDTITPKIGHEICFFSDKMATFLYFYLPISFTVVINGIVLISAKYLRKSKLKNLEKNRNKLNGKASIKQVLSIKRIKNLSRKGGRPVEKQNKNHTGMRTHQSTNMWIESLKLVLWSGITWLTEIFGTIYAMYRIKNHPDWYGYLLYLPVGFNFLRGLGISLIIIFNVDNKGKMLRTYHNFSSRFRTRVSRVSHIFNDTIRRTTERRNTMQETASVNDNNLTFDEGSSMKNFGNKNRQNSTTTIVTFMSDNISTIPDDTEENCIPKFYHSISQVNVNIDERKPVVVEDDEIFSESANSRFNSCADKSKTTSSLKNLITSKV